MYSCVLYFYRHRVNVLIQAPSGCQYFLCLYFYLVWFFMYYICNVFVKSFDHVIIVTFLLYSYSSYLYLYCILYFHLSGRNAQPLVYFNSLYFHMQYNFICICISLAGVNGLLCRPASHSCSPPFSHTLLYARSLNEKQLYFTWRNIIQTFT